MIPTAGPVFGQDQARSKAGMIPKSGGRFSEKIMPHQKRVPWWLRSRPGAPCTGRNRASITPALFLPAAGGFGAQVAQLVEHVTENHGVGGSIPPLGTIFLQYCPVLSLAWPRSLLISAYAGNSW